MEVDGGLGLQAAGWALPAPTPTPWPSALLGPTSHINMKGKGCLPPKLRTCLPCMPRMLAQRLFSSWILARKGPRWPLS